MICTFIKAHDNNNKLYVELIAELRNNNIPYSELISTNEIFRVKAECSQVKIQTLNLSGSYEFNQYNELKNSKKNGLEGVLGSYNFKIENEFLRDHFENLLKEKKMPVVRDVKDNSFRIKNRHIFYIENEWENKFRELKKLNLVEGEYKLIGNESNNTYTVQKIISINH